MQMLVVFYFTFYYELWKMWCARRRRRGERNARDDTRSIFGQISTLFGIYISRYIILLIVANDDEHDARGDTRSLFEHNIRFYLYKSSSPTTTSRTRVVTRGPYSNTI